MQTTEGAVVHRLISKLILTLLIQNGVLDSGETTEGIREMRRQIAESGLEPHIRRQMMRELDKLLQAIAPVAAWRKLN